VLEARPDARIALDRAHLRVHVELLAQRDVHRAEPTADRRRDRAFEGHAGLTDRLEHVGRERIASVLVHDVGAGLADVPVEVDPGRLEHAARRLGQLRADAVAWNENYPVRHAVHSNWSVVPAESARLLWSASQAKP